MISNAPNIASPILPLNVAQGTSEQTPDLEDADYIAFLKEQNLSYIVRGPWLIAGEPCYDNSWLVFLSIRNITAKSVLDIVLPVIKTFSLPFRLIKGKKDHIALNEGLITTVDSQTGEETILEFAKSLTLYLENNEQCKTVLKVLVRSLARFNGPEIPDARRIGNIIYLSRSIKVNKPVRHNLEYQLLKPSNGRLPISPQKGMRTYNTRLKIYKRRFIPLKVLRETHKGIIYKAVDINGFNLAPVLLKLGKAFAFEDIEKRDARHRLRWEWEVQTRFQDLINLPKPIDFFSLDLVVGLAMGWIDGVSLLQATQNIKGDRPWCFLTPKLKIDILLLFMDILTQTSVLHEHDFVHRDLTPGNFIVTNERKTVICDFELCYDLSKGIPSPPFSLGTPGYYSPQQAKGDRPTRCDDIYALGATLQYLLTSGQPSQIKHLIGNDRPEWLRHQIRSHGLCDLINACLEPDPGNRPMSCDLLISKILQEILILSQQ